MDFRLILCLLALAAPGQPSSEAALATFNVEWLADRPGEGAVRRAAADYRNVAAALTHGGAALFCLQEVENDDAMRNLEAGLPRGYGHRMLDTRDRQDQALLFDASRVQVREGPVVLRPELLARYRGRLHLFHRSPLRYYVKIGTFDFHLVQVHLKAGGVGRPASPDFKKRLEECRLLGAWVKDFLRTAPDRDLLVAGDFNDTLGSPALEAFAEESGCRPLTADARRDYSNRKYRVLLDHVFASPDVAEYRPGSARVVHLERFFTAAQLEKISDHDPVVFRFKTQ